MKKSKKKYLTNPRKTDTIRTSISYRSVRGKRGPEFVRSADTCTCSRRKCLQSPPHKWHGLRILTHTTPSVVRCNPEVSGSNPLPATNENRSPWGYGFLIPKGAQSESLRVDGYEKSLLP